MKSAENAEAVICGYDWEADVSAFYADPSIHNYLEIRKKHPGREPPNNFFAGIDPLFAMREDLQKWSIDPALVAATMDADREAIDTLSLNLLALMRDRQDREQAGETHVQSRGVGIPDRLIDYLIVIMFEAMEQYGEPHAVSALNFLVRQRLGGQRMAMHQAFEKKSRKEFVISTMTSARRLGWDTSLRDIASILGMQPSSISRLFEPGELEKSIEFFLAQPPLVLLSSEDEDPMMRALHRNLREQQP